MKFQHPTVREGHVSHEGQIHPIESGIVDCPQSLGVTQGWTPVVEADPIADEKKPTKADKKK